uniref:Uncharacterized protein n=1 Tax=Nelumbo nucifera TaxID=4432 RepID=A0A822YMH1_NELNU|nr:TPA_asm: hypothetical protein HUJ06_012124 [Nelumbo nucifera]
MLFSIDRVETRWFGKSVKYGPAIVPIYNCPVWLHQRKWSLRFLICCSGRWCRGGEDDLKQGKKKKKRERENEQLFLSSWLQWRFALGFTDSKQRRSDARHTFRHLPQETE